MRRLAESLAEVYTTPDEYLAVFRQKKGAVGISISEKHAGNIVALREALTMNMMEGLRPVGCTSVKSIFDHEIGHLLEARYGLRDDQSLAKMYSNLYASNSISDQLSSYAKENISEFIADAWSEF